MMSPMSKPCSVSKFRRDLRSGRFTMEFAPSAAAALVRAANVADPSLILILSDINMPGMSGLEMLPKVRAERPDVPVIMITAYGDAETRRKAIERGAVGLLTKTDRFRAAAPRNRFSARASRMTATILVVDDEPDLEALVLQKFRRQIRDGEVAFIFARDGSKALQLIQDHPMSTWVVSDINMPRMDGLSLLQKLQEAEDKKSTIIVSAYGDMSNIRTAMNRGAFRFPHQADRFRRSRNDHRQDHPPCRDDAGSTPPPGRSRARLRLAVAVFFAADRLPAGLRGEADGMTVHRREVAIIFTDSRVLRRWWRRPRRNVFARLKMIATRGDAPSCRRLSPPQASREAICGEKYRRQRGVSALGFGLAAACFPHHSRTWRMVLSMVISRSPKSIGLVRKSNAPRFIAVRMLLMSP